MVYTLTYTQTSLKDIEKLDRIVRKRIAKKLVTLVLDPIKFSEPLKESKFGKKRFRIGDYRVVFDIEGNEIVILRIGHRREVYKR